MEKFSEWVPDDEMRELAEVFYLKMLSLCFDDEGKLQPSSSYDSEIGAGYFEMIEKEGYCSLRAVQSLKGEVIDISARLEKDPAGRYKLGAMNGTFKETPFWIKGDEIFLGTVSRNGFSAEPYLTLEEEIYSLEKFRVYREGKAIELDRSNIERRIHPEIFFKFFPS